ncbi:hypothetical protein PDL71_01270 [Lacibacter sp. MH-610]|uniref:hypothetical protein n=1 Tax=Lacibacter sp. MH-610 TaxID=3020883 RepID=UPI0038923D70
MRVTIIQLFTILYLAASVGCSATKQAQVIQNEDNLLIEEMYKKDIEIRELDAKTDTVNLEAYDKVHREKIFQLLADNKVITPKDKIRAAWILQHTAAKICDGELTSLSPENFLLAYKLSSSALAELEKKNDTATIRKQNVPRIIALNYDRYLLYSFGYQKFGTQFVFDDTSGEMLLAPIDITLATDDERKKYNVEPLHVLLKKYKMKSMPNKN